MNVKSFFPSVINKWPFQEHFPSITLPTPTARLHFVSEFKKHFYTLA